METIALHGPRLGVAELCSALAVPKATYYRQLSHTPPAPRAAPPRALSSEERQEVLDLLHDPRFVDVAPAQVYAQLLDEGRYVCSERTMYRVLADNAEVKERRNQLRHPEYKKPELLATGPNEVWSWDITKLLGPQKWTYFYLYVLIDIFSRYVVGWLLADREDSGLARKLIGESCERQDIKPGQLTVHADRGPSMTSKNLALLYADLTVTKSHSRPNVSDDNPFSEAQFKTLKYRPDFPERFGSIEDARAHCRRFFDWYNGEHRHRGIGMLTPHEVHHGLAEATRAARAKVLLAAYAKHPERFPHGRPVPAPLPTEVWINRPGAAPLVVPEPSSTPGIAEHGGERAGAVQAGAAAERSEVRLDGPEHSPTIDAAGKDDVHHVMAGDSRAWPWPAARRGPKGDEGRPTPTGTSPLSTAQ
jgi:putative transposase